jgi:hypothetical protein
LAIGGRSDSVTVKNGRLSATESALIAGGRRALIDSMRITGSLDLFVGGLVLTNSVIDGRMSIERGVIVRNNLITSGVGTPWAVRVREGSFVIDNQLRCFGTTCVIIDRYGGNEVSRNVISSRGTAIRVEVGGNEVADNRVLVRTIAWIADTHPAPALVYLSGDVAIDVMSGGNNIRGNYVQPIPIGFVEDLQAFNPWRVGIRFNANGNRYGDNVIGAQVPFELGATVQIDLGGNHPLPVLN